MEIDEKLITKIRKELIIDPSMLTVDEETVIGWVKDEIMYHIMMEVKKSIKISVEKYGNMKRCSGEIYVIDLKKKQKNGNDKEHIGI